MKRHCWLCRALCLAVALLLGAALSPPEGLAQTAPSAVPVTGEHHHHLVFSNQYVRIFDVEVPPHESTLLHQHDADYLWVALGDADVINAVAGKPEARLQVKDGTVHFSKGGFAHIARNDSDMPFRNVTIELLQPQTDARNLCEQAIPASPMNCDTTTAVPPKSKLATLHPVLETDQLRASLLRLGPRGRIRFAPSKVSGLLIAVDEAKIDVPLMAGMSGSEMARSYGPITLHPAHAWPFGSPKSTEDVRSRERTPVRFLLLEFKDALR